MDLNSKSLEGHTALITGASRGIGQAIARHLGAAGATVVGTATTPEGAQRIAEDLAGRGIRGGSVALDVTDLEAMDGALGEIARDYGSPGILVNNAGVTDDALILRMKAEQWERVLQTNLTAIFHLSRHCVRSMIKARHGRIVNVSSVVAFSGNPGQANYCAAKAGMIGFTKALAREVSARGVTVNAVAPGFIDTDMTRSLNDDQRRSLLEQIPSGRFGTVDDVAAAVCFLASAAGAYITGQTLHINGGMLMP